MGKTISTIPPFKRQCRDSFPVMASVMIALVPVILMGWPIDALELRHVESGRAIHGNPVVARSLSLLGGEVRTSIIHSVQLTPVIDEYRVLEGRIWARQEKIMSHNAGLPSLKPERGRFVYDPPWMIVEGTGKAWESFLYRVGTEELGKNELCLPRQSCRELWREIPGKRLVFQVVPSRLL